MHTLPIFEELLGTLGDLRVAYLALLGYLDLGDAGLLGCLDVRLLRPIYVDYLDVGA